MVPPTHGSHRPGKVMEFNPWLEKSWNFMLTWKNGILPGKVIENQWKSLKKFMCHVKLNLNLKIMMIVWLKVSVCHHIWDQIGETMLGTSLAELLVTGTLLLVAAPLFTLPSPVKQHIYTGKALTIKVPCLWWDPCGAEHYNLTGKTMK